MTPLSRPELEALKQRIAIGILTRDERNRVLAAVPALLESASFAERAADFLRAHGRHLLASVERSCRAEDIGSPLRELLRSLPAQPAKEKP